MAGKYSLFGDYIRLILFTNYFQYAEPTLQLTISKMSIEFYRGERYVVHCHVTADRVVSFCLKYHIEF